jgi:hypothetical protein
MSETKLAVVEILGTDIQIPVPDVPESEARPGDAESQALAAHPDFQALLEHGRRAAADGRTVPAAAFFHELEAEEGAVQGGSGARRVRGRKVTSPNGRLLVRVAKSVHQALAERAVREGISVNQLVAGYINRCLGQDEARP